MATNHAIEFCLVGVCPAATRMYNAQVKGGAEVAPEKPFARLQDGRLICSAQNEEVTVRSINFLDPGHTVAQVDIRCGCQVNRRLNASFRWPNS